MEVFENISHRFGHFLQELAVFFQKTQIILNILFSFLLLDFFLEIYFSKFFFLWLTSFYFKNFSIKNGCFCSWRIRNSWQFSRFFIHVWTILYTNMSTFSKSIKLSQIFFFYLNFLFFFEIHYSKYSFFISRF